ncbi:hypothetical protein ACTNEN_09470 [Oribacterium sp. HCP28S3_H8]|jgi:hypothetical protein|uniref:hypothetical protein n=1 Tax=Oribacterium sp. HCP28S3_H8 TaxID=3438945 RepID=UPI003F8A0440
MITRETKKDRPFKRYEGIEHDAKGDFHGPDDEADKDHDGRLDKKPGLGKSKD